MPVSCPSLDDLRAVLDGRLPAEDQAAYQSSGRMYDVPGNAAAVGPMESGTPEFVKDFS
jgi:hypothetical protein